MKLKFTELNSGYKGQRKVNNLSPKSKSKIIIAVVLAVAFAVTFILSSVGIIPLDALAVRAKVAVAGKNDKLPIQIETNSVIRVDTIDDNIIVITKDNIFIYSPNGKQIFFSNHNLSNPALDVCESRAIVYDRNSKKYMLLKKDAIIYEGSSENNIIMAKCSSNGNYAFSTKINGATSALDVFDSNHENIFHWNCGYEYITSIAFSSNGKYIGAAALGAENGEIITTIHHFGVDYNEPLNSQKITGVSPFSLHFSNSDTLILLTDTGVYEINKKSDKYTEKLKYYSSEFNSCDVSSNGKYIVTVAKYGSENVFETYLYSKNGELKQTISTDFEIASSSITEKYIFLLGEDVINVYSLSGKKVSHIKIEGEADALYPTNDFIFVSSLNKISRCFTYGDSIVEA